MDELSFIKKIRKKAGHPGPFVKAGIGDDCAVLEYKQGRYLLWADDMLIEDTHFKLPECSYRQIGRKAVAVNISDIAAMGGIPKYITVSLGLPVNVKANYIDNLYKGIFDICKEYGIKLIGGDTNRSKKLIVDVSILGEVEKKNLVMRSGAKAGDRIYITGPVRNGKTEHLSFEPRIKEARYLTGKYKINSMIDVSDGIALDLGRICEESKTGCVLYSEKIPRIKGLSLKDALHYGESFELLFTVSEKQAAKIKTPESLRGVYPIGEIVSGQKGLKVVESGGRVKDLDIKGFKHF